MIIIVIIREHTSSRALLLQRQSQRSAGQGLPRATRLDQQADAENGNPRVLVRARQPDAKL